MLKYLILALIWSAAILEALVGFIYSPNYRVRRTAENQKLFWSVWTVQCGLAAFASYLVFQLPF